MWYEAAISVFGFKFVVRFAVTTSVPSAFFCSFYFPYFFFYTLSPISTVSSPFLTSVYFFSFLCFFSTRKREVFHSSPTSVTEAWRSELASWQKALLLSGCAGRGLELCCCEDFPEVILELVQQFTVKGLQL